LEEQRGNLRSGLEKLPARMRQYYLDRIADLDQKIDASKRRFPQFCGNYNID